MLQVDKWNRDDVVDLEFVYLTRGPKREHPGVPGLDWDDLRKMWRNGQAGIANSPTGQWA